MKRFELLAARLAVFLFVIIVDESGRGPFAIVNCGYLFKRNFRRLPISLTNSLIVVCITLPNVAIACGPPRMFHTYWNMYLIGQRSYASIAEALSCSGSGRGG